MVYLNRIYTKSGDAGETSLGDGSRVPKTDLRIVAYGTVDELNSVLGIARAEAELDQLERRKLTVHNQIVQDVQTAFARYQQSRAELDALKGKTRPEVEAAIKRAQAAFEKGGVTYLLVLETNRQLIDTYAREAQLYADLRRAWAELERSLGRRLK